jgi:putative CocE/NonD family hydrolase
MNFTIYSNEVKSLAEAKRAASYGYAGLVVDARGKRLSTDRIRPYEMEVDDTNTAIDWASRQRWSDGRVVMYGGSYGGFTAWAATKHLHPALKAISAWAAAIPGQGLPMENNIFLNANYAWIFYVSNNRMLDTDLYSQRARWNGLRDAWYTSGRPYREIDRVDGLPNPWLQRWLDHPAYDAYWQAMVPYGTDFARINIPVLSITGYYDDGQVSALHYVREHLRHRPAANHTVVIGPYDHFGSQSAQKPSSVNGMPMDQAAQFDTPDLAFTWFNHVLHGAPRPAMLKDKINFEVMGANRWDSAPSLDAMGPQKLKLYLAGAALQPQPPAPLAHRRLKVDLADRSTSSNDYYPYPAIGKELDPEAGLRFVSAPFEQPMMFNGAISGQLRVKINKRDFDYGLSLYEWMPDGRLFSLGYVIGRASFARDMARRQLLRPGRVETIPVGRGARLVSRQMEAGSRLLLVVDVNKNPFAQVNYGSGKDVSLESSHDAGKPLQLEVRNDSYVVIPLKR